MHLKVFAQHLELLIATFVLLRVHRWWYLVFGLLISADKFKLLFMSLVSDSLLATNRR